MAGVGVVSPHKLLQKERREIIILRKTPILPQPKDEILITNTSRKKQKEPQKTAPQPIAVARRNARERNRVKQVNNGFANLRQHIPSFIASTFESNSRGGNKKLSKVETLRMAVEYIRSLEDLLSLDDSTMSNASSVSSPTTYHDEDFYDVDDHILSDPSLMDADLEFRGAQDLSLLTGMHGGDSLSPGMYSEQSLSPGGSDQRGYGSTYGDEGKSEDVPVISLKTENELPQGGKNVMDVMQWWEQQQGTRATVS